MLDVLNIVRRLVSEERASRRPKHLLGFVRCHFDGVFTGDIGYDNVHPPLIAFLNIIKIPVLPAPAFGFGLSNRRGRFFRINDALRSRQRRTLMDDNLKMCVINILNGIVG